MKIARAVRPLWTAVRDEVLWLHTRWEIYRQLFGSTRERIDVLNRAAGMAFRVLGDALLRDVEMTLANLVDTRRGAAGLKLLRDRLKPLIDHKLLAEIDKSLHRLEAQCEKVRRRRDKRHAHFDYWFFAYPAGFPLPAISRREIEGVLRELRRFMTLIEVQALGSDSETLYKLVSVDDGERLLEVLERGLDSEHEAR